MAKIVVHPNGSELSFFKEHIKEQELASIDTETTGLYAYSGDKLFCITVSTLEHDFYFDFNEEQNNLTLLERKIIPTLLGEFQGILFAHNAKFDMHMLANEGLDLSKYNIHCTEAIARLVDNQLYNLQLATLVKALGLEKSKAVDDYIKKHKLYRIVKGGKAPCYDLVPFDVISPYAMTDTNITLRLGIHQINDLHKQQAAIDKSCPTLQKERNLLTLLDVEKKLTKTLFHMERRGVKIDRAYTLEAMEYEVAQYKNIEKLFKEWCGIDFKDDKTTLVKALLAAGEDIPRTAKGNYCLDKNALEGMDTPLAVMVKDWRRSFLMAHTYYENFLFFADENDIIHPNFQQGGARTGRLSARYPNMQNCLGLDVEILTPLGYKKYNEVKTGDLVATYNTEKRVIEYQEIENYIFKEFDDVVNIKSQHISIDLTHDHRFLIETRYNQLQVDPAISLRSDKKMLHASVVKNSVPSLNEDIIKYIVAVQADSYLGGKTQRIFAFSKTRKIKRLELILKSMGIPYRKALKNRSCTRKQQYKISLKLKDEPKEIDYFLTDRKFNYNLLSLSTENRITFLKELKHWDGLSTRDRIEYCTKEKINADVIQAIGAITNTRIKVSYNNNMSGRMYYYVYGVLGNNYSWTTNVEKICTGKKPVWCVTVPNGFIVTRSGGNNLITGNCPSKGEDTAVYPVRRCFVPLEGYLWVSIDWKAMEYRLMLDYAGEMQLIAKVKMGHDVHEATGQLVNMIRSLAKNVNFALLYGTGNAHLGLMIGKSEREAKAIRNKYFSKLPAVKRLIDTIKRAVKTRGYVITNYGRKLKVERDKDYVGANYLIQGGCADMMKKSLVEIDEFLIEKKCKSHLILTVHDEADLQIHLSELELIEPIAKIMENIYEYTHLPMAVDVECSLTSWAELKEFDYGSFRV